VLDDKDTTDVPHQMSALVLTEWPASRRSALATMLLQHQTVPSEMDTSFWQQAANVCNELAAHSKEHVFCGELSSAVQCQIKRPLSSDEDLSVAISAVLLHDQAGPQMLTISKIYEPKSTLTTASAPCRASYECRSNALKRAHADGELVHVTQSMNGAADSKSMSKPEASKLSKLSVSTSTTDLAALGPCGSQTDLAAMARCEQHRYAACT